MDGVHIRILNQKNKTLKVVLILVVMDGVHILYFL